MLFKLAWGNLWRNRRRTLITMASVFFAVILSTLMMSLKEGVYENMIKSMVGSFTGYAQVHAQGYWEDKMIDNGFMYEEAIGEKVLASPYIKEYIPRLESYALAASYEQTKGVMVVGVDPEKEISFSKLPERIAEGEYIADDDEAVMVGKGLSGYLGLEVGDTIVMLGQGYHGVSAAGKYPIKAVIKFGSPELSKQLIMLPIKEAQWLYGAEDSYTSLVLIPNDLNTLTELKKDLSASLGESYEVMDWIDLLPDLNNMIETDRVEGYVFMFILYMVISFGIFGTLLMMLAERRHEFGVLVAVGMKRIKLAFMVWIELIIMSLMGAALGMLGALPVCTYFYLNPIRLGDDMTEMIEEYGMEGVLKASLEPSIFTQQASIVFVVACVISIYAFIKIVRMDAIKAMRS